MDNTKNDYLYELKSTLITKSESSFFNAIKNSVPENHYVFPQINLASFIDRKDNSKFHNELFRNVDFLITDENYKPKIIIEINDKTHLTPERKERDEKVKYICEEAGIPIIKLWTSYGVNSAYISKKITETLASLPIQRISHKKVEKALSSPPPSKKSNQNGCYIATCIYNSYDCPEVWILRRYRDYKLKKSWYGRMFIKLYYATSPTVVDAFGNYKWFKYLTKIPLNKMIKRLRREGYSDKPYEDN